MSKRLDNLYKTKSQPKRTYSPFAAVQTIEQERSKRDYANYTTLDLLGLEEEFTSRISWLDEQNNKIPDSDKRGLEDVSDELSHSSRLIDLPTIRENFARRNKWRGLYPETGPYSREAYYKHIAFYAQGKDFNERLLLGSNRSGKTVCGAYETTCHATGIYPDWWPGRKFYEPIDGWIANKGAKDVRDINEQELLGPLGNLELRGTGMLPSHRILKCTPKTGTPNAVEFIYVRHVSGGVSMLQSKSFDQGREAFQGTKKHVIWPDEECPQDVYGEMVLRTMPTSDFSGGIVYVTYTPILGLTPLTTEFLQAAGIEIDGQPMTTMEQKAS